ncbi:MAG: hypothetical protein FJ164_04105 [Gammaproteobacteria bacterium]|nr:hypothetical protein [Gammaproteobacteria bacterium]
MRLLTLLLLCLPLTVFADEHATEHGGTPAEHGGAPAEEKAPAAEEAKSEHGGAPAEEKK